MKLFFQLCIVFWNAAIGLINLIIERHNKKIIEKNNQIRRGIDDIPSLTHKAVFNDGCMKTAVVSGSNKSVRAKLLSEAIQYAHCMNRKVVVLHKSDKELEQRIGSMLGNSAIIVNDNNPCFDPFYHRTDADIIRMVNYVAKKEYTLNEEMRYCIEGILAYLKEIGKRPSLQILTTCPYNDLPDKLDKRVNAGKISDVKAENIRSMILAGQKEYIKVKGFLDDLKSQSKSIVYGANRTQNCYDILKAFQENRVILFDLSVGRKRLLLDILLSQLEIASDKYSDISVVIDDITVETNHETMRSFLDIKTTTCTYTIATDDLYSMLCSDKNIFHTVIGNSDKKIIMQHSPNKSAEEWSNTIGYYEKIESSSAYSKGKTKGGVSLFPSYNNNQTTTYITKREPIVKSEQIQKLKENEVFFYDKSQNKLFHTYMS